MGVSIWEGGKAERLAATLELINTKLESKNGYLAMLNGNVEPDIPVGDTVAEITINRINSLVIGGNTVYYITADNGQHFELYVTVNTSVVPFIEENDTVEVCYYQENGLNKITQIRIIEKVNDNQDTDLGG